ncbi:hypothetical protein SVAN01_05846 [Stagonosporopsis vannaccii]|nr:hypothetical protein SVAN01_05846 [Stagonosporopsis vannaccii]
MSFHTRCPQRIGSRTPHRTVWRRRGARCYASKIVDEPEWFQQVRTEMLSRNGRRYDETLNSLNYQQLRATLKGFQPAAPRATKSPAISPLSRLLTRFNAHMRSSQLLSDGTDPIHSPGGQWERRMWAGGAVKFNPSFNFGPEGLMGSWKKVTCFERIKDVRLQGTGAEAKVFVTVERSFSHTQGLNDDTKLRPKDNVRAKDSQQVGHTDDWSGAFLKEERNLVFLKPKTAAELNAVSSGQLLVPRYLKSPIEPDYSHSLTPTRSLLFRYSALTFNAHLLHLDREYARNIEGHRNVLVHGPLTLTLMLQVLNRHLLKDEGTETVVSIEYRNLAPLYCEEEMRVCVKKRKSTDRVNIWDIWIEGPTGGMAVKAVANTVGRGTAAPLSNTMDQNDSGTEQLSGLSHARRRELRRKEKKRRQREQRKQEKQRSKRSEHRVRPVRALSYLYSASSPLVVRLSETSPSAQPLPQLFAVSPPFGARELRPERSTLLESEEQTPSYSKRSRTQRVGKALRYLYLESQSPLLCSVDVTRQLDSESTCADDIQEPPSFPHVQQPSEDSASSEEPIYATKRGRTQVFAPFSRNWRTWRTGKALRYLYLGARSPLLRGVEVQRQSEPAVSADANSLAGSAGSSPSSELPIVPNIPTSSFASVAPSPPFARLNLAQRQRAVLLASPPAPRSEPENPASSTPSGMVFRKIEGEGTLRPRFQKSAQQDKERAKPPVIRKIDQLSLRRVDSIGLREAARRREHQKRSRKQEKVALEEPVLSADRASKDSDAE